MVNVIQGHEGEEAVEAHSWMTNADVANKVLRHRYAFLLLLMLIFFSEELEIRQDGLLNLKKKIK